MPYFFRGLFLLGFVTLSACALVDGIMGPAMFTSEEICDQVQRIRQDCDDSYDATSCNKFVTCTQENKNNCDERWDEWVRCLRDSEPSCNEASEDTLPCREKAEYFLTCVGDNNLEEGYYIIDDCISRNDLPSPDPVCDDGICQIEADENPDQCPDDCLNGCSADEEGYCTPFRAGCPECSSDGDGSCSYLSENDYSSTDCQCVENGRCELGESIFGCPNDCHCNFDGICDGDETNLSCLDCARCTADTCQSDLGEACVSDIDCMIPLNCRSSKCSVPDNTP